MKLADIIDSIHVKSVSGTLDLDIENVAFDSRKVQKGTVFCALPGVNVDGNEFIEASLDAGGIGPADRARFYHDNMARLLGR